MLGVGSVDVVGAVLAAAVPAQGEKAATGSHRRGSLAFRLARSHRLHISPDRPASCFELFDVSQVYDPPVVGVVEAVSYTHLTLPTNREV